MVVGLYVLLILWSNPTSTPPRSDMVDVRLLVRSKDTVGCGPDTSQYDFKRNVPSQQIGVVCSRCVLGAGGLANQDRSSQRRPALFADSCLTKFAKDISTVSHAKSKGNITTYPVIFDQIVIVLEKIRFSEVYAKIAGCHVVVWYCIWHSSSLQWLSESLQSNN